MTIFRSADIEAEALTWEQKVREPHPIYIKQMEAPFTVETDSGLMTGQPGDYLAYDPESKHAWPVKASYLAQHYRAIPPGVKKMWIAWS